MSVRHFVRDDDLRPDEQRAVLDLADDMKRDRLIYQPFSGPRAVAVIFDKPSTRTRVSFSVGIAELGGYPLVIDAHASQLGRGEPIEDTTRVLDRQVAAIVWRTYAQARIEAMARVSRFRWSTRSPTSSIPASSWPTCRRFASDTAHSPE